MNTNTNPPAFPFVAEDDTGMMINMGMTIRDYFAAKAMQGICARVQWSSRGIAETAYDIADAMMEARNAE